MCQCRYIDSDMGAPFGALAQNLVNSYDPTHSPPEYLQTAADLKAFLALHGLPSHNASAADLPRVRRLRAEVRAIFEAPDPGKAIAGANEVLRRARPELQLKAEGGAAAFEWGAGGASVIERLNSAVALNLGFLLELYGFERLRICDADPCVDVFVDVSKQGARRYCAVDCANRARIAQFRARTR